MFSDHSMFSEIKLEISNRKITGKFLNTWKLNNILLKIHRSNRKSQRKF